MTDDKSSKRDKRKLWVYRILTFLSFSPVALLWSGAVMAVTMVNHGTAPGLYAYFACLAAASGIDRFLMERHMEIHELRMRVRS